LLKIFGKLHNGKFETTPLRYSIIIPAFNEEKVLAQKIANTAAIIKDYSAQVIVVANGTNDGSEKWIAKEYTLIHSKKRKGKSNDLNEAVSIATGDIFVFTDANAIISESVLAELSKSFSDTSVGIVTGCKTTTTNATEHHYWTMENILKSLESSFHSAVSAPGELLAIRRELYTPIPANRILDDFYLSTMVASKGYRIQLNPAITSIEMTNSSLKDEFQRRKRMAAGAMQWMHLDLFRFIGKMPRKYLWQLVSNKICRWILAPLALLVIFVTTAIVQNEVTQVLLFFFLLLTMLGFLIKKPYWVRFPFYFFFVHFCLLYGYIQYFFGKATVLWKKVDRN
jgi:cellulose synthase/poly-beta-1,6-N-acetylglucosamine synthase-like glycosyltransferase